MVLSTYIWPSKLPTYGRILCRLGSHPTTWLCGGHHLLPLDRIIRALPLVPSPSSSSGAALLHPDVHLPQPCVLVRAGLFQHLPVASHGPSPSLGCYRWLPRSRVAVQLGLVGAAALLPTFHTFIGDKAVECTSFVCGCNIYI